MNLYDIIINDNPYAAFAFNANATSYASIAATGVTMTATPAGVQSTHTMNTGKSKSLYLTAGAELSIPFPDRFHNTAFRMPFTLSAWLGLDAFVPGTVLGHKGQSDGLYFDADFIYFAVKLTDGSFVRTSWPLPDVTKNYQAVGTYNGNRVSLYIDGALVSEAAIPDGLRIATQADTNLYAQAPSGAAFRIESPAIYMYELTPEQVKRQYDVAMRIAPTLDNVSRIGGTLYRFSDLDRDVRYVKDIDWTMDGFGLDLDISSELRPNYDTSDLSVAASYTITVPIADLDAPVNAQGMKVEWSGDGNFTVECSIDNGTTWTALGNGIVPTNTVGLSGTITPQVRISFAAGRAKNLDVVRNMRITVYSSNIVYSANNRERTALLTGAPTTSDDWTEPVQNDKSMGLSNTASGARMATINESTEVDRFDVGTIELWLPANAASGTYIVDSRSVTPANTSYIWLNGSRQVAFAGFSAVYVDGAARTSGTYVPVAGRMMHIVAVYSAPHNAKIALGPTGGTEIRMAALYPNQLTAAEAIALYNSYFGYPSLKVDDTNAIVLSETAPAAKAYVKDWSVTGGGG